MKFRVSKAKTIRKKKIPVKQVDRKSSKVSIPISDLDGKPFLDIQVLVMNTNIVIPVLPKVLRKNKIFDGCFL